MEYDTMTKIDNEYTASLATAHYLSTLDVPLFEGRSRDPCPCFLNDQAQRYDKGVHITTNTFFSFFQKTTIEINVKN